MTRMTPRPPDSPRPVGRGRAAVVGAVALWLALGGCFESGPLAVATRPLGGDATAVEDGAATTSDAAAVDATTDATATDATATDATQTATDATQTATDATQTATDVTAGDASDAGDTDVADVATEDVVAKACLVDDDCAGVPITDRCAGTIRCIDYGCRPDPVTAVQCLEPTPADPCVTHACDPSSGLCAPVEHCACIPDSTLGCGQTLTFSTNDLGPTDHFSAYACGPAAGPWIERLVAFAPSAGRVRLDLESTGTTGFHVLALDGSRCDAMTGCITGAASRAYYDADGQPTIVAVDYAAGNSLVKLTATCGIASETACGDHLDDDADGLTDCVDRDCSGIGNCPFVPNDEHGVCKNGIDDDQDGITDCAETECANDAGCLETCDVLPIQVGCGFHQGAPTGGGRAKATHYACSDVPAPGIEVVYRFRPSFTGVVDVAFASLGGIAVYLLVDTGRGCTPRDCLDWGLDGFSFTAVEGTTYYFAVDAPADVEGDFDLHVTCEAL